MTTRIGGRPLTQAEAAEIYAKMVILVDNRVDGFWIIFNSGIHALWPSESGLERVKKMAWKILDCRIAKGPDR